MAVIIIMEAGFATGCKLVISMSCNLLIRLSHHAWETDVLLSTYLGETWLLHI